MRTWIMQPASMIIHSQAMRYSAWTILGMMTLTATIVAMLYTTAAEALGECAVSSNDQLEKETHLLLTKY